MTKQHSGNSSASNWLLTLVLLVMLLVLSTAMLSAAEAPRIQVFGGYTRMQFDSKAFGFTSDTGLNGGTVGAAFNLAPYFGVKGQISVETGPNIRSRDWLIGPQGMYSKWGMLFFGDTYTLWIWAAMGLMFIGLFCVNVLPSSTSHEVISSTT